MFRHFSAEIYRHLSVSESWIYLCSNLQPFPSLQRKQKKKQKKECPLETKIPGTKKTAHRLSLPASSNGFQLMTNSWLLLAVMTRSFLSVSLFHQSRKSVDEIRQGAWGKGISSVREMGRKPLRASSDMYKYCPGHFRLPVFGWYYVDSLYMLVRESYMSVRRVNTTLFWM